MTVLVLIISAFLRIPLLIIYHYFTLPPYYTRVAAGTLSYYFAIS